MKTGGFGGRETLSMEFLYSNIFLFSSLALNWFLHSRASLYSVDISEGFCAWFASWNLNPSVFVASYLIGCGTPCAPLKIFLFSFRALKFPTCFIYYSSCSSVDRGSSFVFILLSVAREKAIGWVSFEQCEPSSEVVRGFFFSPLKNKSSCSLMERNLPDWQFESGFRDLLPR